MNSSLTGLAFFSVVIALVQRAESSPEKKMRIARGVLGLTASCFGVFSYSAAWKRGLSTTSLLMVVIATMGCICAVFLVFRVFAKVIAPTKTGSGQATYLTIAPALRPQHTRLRYLHVLASGFYYLASMVPASYVGLGSYDIAVDPVASALSLGTVTPLSSSKTIMVDQCIKQRTIADINVVVACSVRHRSQVVEVVGADGTCPEPVVFVSYDRVLQLKEFIGKDGFKYCVIRTASKGWLTGRLVRTEPGFTG